MRDKISALGEEAGRAVLISEDTDALESLRVRFLGKKGELTAILKQMGALSAEERPIIGALANTVRAQLEELIDSRRGELRKNALSVRLISETIDVTMPGTEVKIGKKHPMKRALDEAVEIFIGMGFTIAEGPEIEYAELNFDRLNAPAGHPARDRQDTFYFDDDDRILLRPQTSPVQVRYMDSHKPPIRVISPGRVYRKDEVDATHSPMFHQIEGLVVDKGVTMAELKGTLNTMVERLYGAGTKTRFRPHHFPFTEPSCEVDMQCFECGGEGCHVCKGEGWIELLGAGMVHPKVLAGCEIDPLIYSGFAFGIGLERMAMRRFNISDLRLIFENDIRFLRQF